MVASYLPFFLIIEIMGCTKCKKKKEAIEVIDSENITVSAYQLRDNISYEQLGLSNPTDTQIKKFLEANPNRKSLFKLIPDNVEQMSKN